MISANYNKNNSFNKKRTFSSELPVRIIRSKKVTTEMKNQSRRMHVSPQIGPTINKPVVEYINFKTECNVSPKMST